MQGRWLKPFRAAAACVVLVGLFAAFADFRGMVPASLAHSLASIQFVPSMVALLTGSSLAIAGLVILVATLVAGRIYCSVVCPLGVLQDVIARLARWLPGKRKGLRYSTGHRRWQWVFLGAGLAGVLAGWAGFTLSLLDPYSIFGRIVFGLFRPLVTLINNSLVRIGNACGVDSIYRVDPQWVGAGALALPALMLVLVLVLAAWRGRLYCNTVCPVGTLLGFLSSRGLWRLGVDQSACRKCGDCLRVCKSQCIDLRSGAIDFSRCVACFNCVGACREHAIGYRFGWSKTPGPRPAPKAPDWQRRKFLADGAGFAGALGTGIWVGKAGAGKMSRAIAPPGAAGVERFLNRCTACQLCISACPTHVLQPAVFEYGLAGLMKPRLDYSHSFCNFECIQCGKICPDGAITLLDLAVKKITRIGRAMLDLEKCVVKTKGTDCAACSEHCPTKAVDTIPFGNNLRLPKVDETLCIGCGACEYACPVKPTKAITVAGISQHERAEKRIEGAVQKPKTNGDFPF